MLTIPKNKICVTPLFDPSVSKGGIIIPDIAKERCDQGIIKYVGEGVTGLKVGDYVLFSGYSGTLIALEGEGNIIILHTNDVRAVINPDDIEIPGLYMKAPNGNYFVAPYYIACEFMAKAYEEAGYPTKIRLTNKITDKTTVSMENKNEY